MKDFVYWCLGIWFIICMVCFLVASYEYDDYSKQIQCGDKIVVGSDTLIVTNVNMFNEIQLHTGATIHVDDALKLKVK